MAKTKNNKGATTTTRTPTFLRELYRRPPTKDLRIFPEGSMKYAVYMNISQLCRIGHLKEWLYSMALEESEKLRLVLLTLPSTAMSTLQSSGLMLPTAELQHLGFFR